MTDEHIEVLAKSLVAGGIRYAFGVTGSGASLKLISALSELGVRYFPVGHEAAAALMAGACGQHDQVRAVAITVKGPGYVNLAPGMFANLYEGRPSLTISEAFGSSVPLFRRHKRINQAELARPLTKAYDKCSGEATQIDELLSIAYEEYPGPVHLDLCSEPEHDRTVFQIKATPDPSGSTGAGEIIERIESSERPVLALGSVAGRKLMGINWSELRVPMVTTAAAKGVVDETGPFSGGIITGEITELSPETGIISHADLVVAIGLRDSETVVPQPFQAPLVSIDEVQKDYPSGYEPWRSIVTPELASISNTVHRVLQGKSWGQQQVTDHRRCVDKAACPADWIPGPAFKLIQEKLVEENVTLVLDSGFFCTVGEALWKTRRPHNFLGSSVCRFMGIAIPSAIGRAIGNPGSTLVCVFGDGGIPPYAAEIKTAVQEHLPILFILMSDGRYGSVAAYAPDTEIVRRAVDVVNPSWWHTIKEMGCPAARVDSLGQLDTAISNWRHERGPLFLELSFDPKLHANTAQGLR